MTTEKVNSLMNYFNWIIEKGWGRLLLSSILFLIILGPFLFGGHIFYNGDLISYTYPFYHLYQDDLRQEESFFWNPYNFSGFASFTGTMKFFSPVHFVLFKFLPFFTAYNLIIFLDLTLAFFLTWQLLRKFNLSIWIGFVGGLVYVFSQWIWITNIAVANALPILPLLFLVLWRAKEKKDNWPILFGGLVIGYAWFSIHYNWLVMILSVGFLFAVFLGWSDNKRWLIPLKFILMTLGGSLIGLLVILPLLVYSPLSARSVGLSYSQSLGGALVAGDFVRYLLPYFHIPFFSLTNSQAQLYLGILPLFFLIFVLKFRSSLINFFSFLFFICLLISISYSPLFWLLHQLPVFNAFRGPHRWMFIGGFAAAVLVGFGMQKFLSQEREKLKKLLLKILKWLSWLILISSVVFSLIFYLFRDKFISIAQNYFDKHLYGQTSGLPIDYYHRFIEGLFSDLEEVFYISNPKVFLSIIFLFISYFVLVRFYRNKIATRYFLPVISLVILLNFLLIFVFYQPSISLKEYSRQPETVKFLKEHPGRYFSFLPGFSEYNKLTVPYQPDFSDSFIFQSELLPPNMNLLYGLESADYYDNLMSRPMSRLLALIGSDRATFGEKLTDLNISSQEKVELFEQRKKIVDLLGIRYIITAFSLDKEKFIQVFETKVPPYDIPLAIYENEEARPLIYFADKVEVIEPDEERAYQKLLEDSLEGKSIFIECSDCPEQLDVNGQRNIILEEKTNSLARLRTKSDNSQWLVFSENYLPGWRAYLDNEEISIYRVNSVYMGILIPSGEHKVLFKYNLYTSL